MALKFTKDYVNTNKQTKEAPSIAYLDGTLYMLRKDTDSYNIWFCKYDVPSQRMNVLDGNWTKSKKTGQKTGTAPALVAYDGRLLAVWKDWGKNTLYYGFVDTDTGKIAKCTKIEGSKTDDAPTLSINYGKVFMWHTGKSGMGYLYRNKYDGKWSGDKQITVKGEADPRGREAPSASMDGKNNIVLFHRGTTNSVYRVFYLDAKGHYGEAAALRRKDNFLTSKIPPTIFHSYSEKATYALVKADNINDYDFKGHGVETNQLVLLRDLDPKGVSYKFYQALKYDAHINWAPIKPTVKVETDKRVAVAVIERDNESDQVIMVFKDHDSNYLWMMATN